MSVDGASKLLTRAVELDGAKRWTEAIVCYQEGIQMLMDGIKATKDEARRAAYRKKVKECLDRAERLSERLQEAKKSGQYHEVIPIAEDQTGCSYQSLFGRLLDDAVTSVKVEDPYIRSHHQVVNFLRLCELFVRRCPSLAHISLLTGQDVSPQAREEQERKLNDLADDLLTRNVRLVVKYSDTLHDREIRLDSGWMIKLGRGLDIYKANRSKMSIGQFDLDLRRCHQTTVDIFHRSNVVMSK